MDPYVPPGQRNTEAQPSKEEVTSKELIVSQAPPVIEAKKLGELQSESCIESPEDRLSKRTMDELLVSREGSENAIRLSRRMMRLKNVDTTPFIIMSCFRYPRLLGMLGGYPVHQHNKTDGYNFIAGLTEQELDELRAKNIPGLMEVIELVRDNATPERDFRGVYVENPKYTRLVEAYDSLFGEDFGSLREARGRFKVGPGTGFEGMCKRSCEAAGLDFGEMRDMIERREGHTTEIENPAYREIQENLEKLCLHLMVEGDDKQKIFTLGLIEELGTCSSESYDTIGQVLRETQNEDVQRALVDTMKYRAKYKNELKAAFILTRNYGTVSQQVKNIIKEYSGDMAEMLLSEELEDKKIEALSQIMDRSADEIRDVNKFVTGIADVYGSGPQKKFSICESDFDAYLAMARIPGALELITDLAPYGFYIGGEDAQALPTAIEDKKSILHSLEEIREILPNYTYDIKYKHEYNPQTEREEKVFITDPYETLFSYTDTRQTFKALENIQNKLGEIPRRYSDGVFRRSKHIRHQEQPSKEEYLAFNRSLNTFLVETNSVDSKLFKWREHTQNSNILEFLAKEPERVNEITGLPEETPNLFPLFEPGGPLHSNRDQVFNDIFSHQDPIRRAKEVETIFNKKMPYWKQLFLFTETRIGKALEQAKSEYPISAIAGTARTGRIPLTKLRGRDRWSDLVVEGTEPDESGSIPFNRLTPKAKKMAMRQYLRNTIQTTRSSEAKNQADERNKRLATEKLTLAPGTYLHGAAFDYTPTVFLNGNLPGELLGPACSTDRFPFHVDFGRITEQEVQETRGDTRKIVEGTIPAGYGKGGSMGADGQTFYIYDRREASWEPGVDYTVRNFRQGLILGGMPATETTAIVLRNPEATLEAEKKAVLESGFYTPLYDMDGNLLFTPQEYDTMREDLNLKVPVDEVWDMSMKTGEALGSNPGGTYMAPTKTGPAGYYVKTAKSEWADQVWNEQLADDIYRLMDTPVPETQVVRVEGNIGHASRMLDDAQEGAGPDLKNGFLLDCLLANWDVIAHSGNTLTSGGTTYRIDNGGSLLFRARGERRTNFNEAVTELTSMRHGYSGLTEEDIKKQAEEMRDKLTDEAIDSLVDGVRLSRQDRDTLKTTLKKRRDYTTKTVLAGETLEATPEQITLQTEVLDILKTGNLVGNERLAELIPEWVRMTGPAGFQHNRVLLGQHTEDVVKAVRRIPEWSNLGEREQELALMAALFHDFGKPTGRVSTAVSRDFEHEAGSIMAASEYMTRLGFTGKEIATVTRVIEYDGIVSDIAREKVRDPAKKLEPHELRGRMETEEAIRILQAVNRADVIGTVGENGFKRIEARYNKYFQEMLK